jgi:hypothetical protein
VKACDNWRITWKLQETAKKCQQTTNRKSGSGYLLKIISPLGAHSQLLNPPDANNLKTVTEGEKCQQTTNRKSGSGYLLKLFSPLRGAFLAAEPNKRK